ncbi:hypothetical protein [Alkalicoccus luteus]|uniref:Uncharacterized protein n=1 Tax=Alkalicoccus luteus TaxID=1237094 RepID=A0A969TWH9_9BACI|nr:hypothetical protein [Alkalicoccus luteus]NJP39217.1 hypothetical protein [Alkalicoccus luteus]
MEQKLQTLEKEATKLQDRIREYKGQISAVMMTSSAHRSRDLAQRAVNEVSDLRLQVRQNESRLNQVIREKQSLQRTLLDRLHPSGIKRI